MSMNRPTITDSTESDLGLILCENKTIHLRLLILFTTYPNQIEQKKFEKVVNTNTK